MNELRHLLFNVNLAKKTNCLYCFIYHHNRYSLTFHCHLTPKTYECCVILVSELLIYVNGECYRFCGNIHTSRHCLSWLYLSWSWLHAEEIFLYQGDEKQDGHMLPEEVLSMLWLGKLCHGCILLLIVTKQFVVKCNSMSVVAVHNRFVLLTIYLCMF